MKISKWTKVTHIYSRLGIINGTKYIFNRLRGSSTLSIRAKHIKHPVLIRFDKSDVDVFEQIFLFDEYDFEVNLDPKLIIDAGGNVGYAGVFFANKFPNAKIFSIEPEPNNFKVLTENVKAYPNIIPLKAALWNEQKDLFIHDRSTGSWGFNVTEDTTSGSTVKSVTIDQLLEQSGFNQIDILKIDIEGAEKPIFEKNFESWLDKVEIIAVEIHDYIEKNTSKTVFEAIRNYNFDMSVRGEYIVLTKF